MDHDQPAKIGVLIPCYNEERTVADVVEQFFRVLPTSNVYVFDNNSTDRTADLARAAGAIVISSPRQGKGHVVRQMFECVEADIYLMVDGDSTYPASEAPQLIRELLESKADMVVGTRLNKFQNGSFRRFHQFGNQMISSLIRALFGCKVVDVLSGYRAFTRDFVKTIPLMSGGFEIEVELTLQAAAKRMQIREVAIGYGERPSGSVSKLNTFGDGWVIIKSILFILKDYKPFLFFSALSGFSLSLSLALGAVPVKDYIENQFVTHVPLAVLAAALGVVGALFFGVGVILETVHRYHNENFMLLQRILRNK